MKVIDSANLVLDRVSSPGIYVAVSGGKDSIATLDLCVRKFGVKRVRCFMMYLVKDLECEWNQIRRVEKKYGIQVQAVPHWNLSRILKTGMGSVKARKDVRELKQTDVEAYVTGDSGWWVAWGMKAADSTVRNAMLKQLRGVDAKHRRAYPIWEWKKADVYGYLRAKDLPIPQIIGGGVSGGGVGITATDLIWVRDNFPGDYKKILREFPMLEARVFRHETMGIDPIADRKSVV